MNLYSLESLIETFLDHSKKADNQRQKWIADFKENCPNEELPEHMKDEFSVATALAAICIELLKLRDKNEK